MTKLCVSAVSIIIVGAISASVCETGCYSSISQDDCRAGEILELNLGQSPCPKCRGGLAYNASRCDQTNMRCAPGLFCHPATGTCLLDKTKCSYTRHLPAAVTQRPTCELDGSFAAKQCKGDMVSGRCFCYSETGERIFGWAWRREAVGMTCACSRQRIQLAKSDRVSTVHCNQMGDFERLQCDDAICWCADPKTGYPEAGTRAVPEQLITQLPCYTKAIVGDMYLRECESRYMAVDQFRRAVAVRGILQVPLEADECGFDGNYGLTTLQEENILACSWYDGKIFHSYRMELDRLTGPMLCTCAIDAENFATIGQRMPLDCDRLGHYNPWQITNRQSFCVDADGFAVSDFVNIQKTSDCDQYLYYEYE